MAILAYIYSYFKVTANREGLLAQDDWTKYAVNVEHSPYLHKVGLFLNQYVDEKIKHISV